MSHSHLSTDALRQTIVEQLKLIIGLPDDEPVVREADQVLPLDTQPSSTARWASVTANGGIFGPGQLMPNQRRISDSGHY